MKVTRIGDKYFDENGNELTWRHLSELTGLERGRSRILLKKLAETGAEVEESQLLDWRADQVLIWTLTHIHGIIA